MGAKVYRNHSGRHNGAVFTRRVYEPTYDRRYGQKITVAQGNDRDKKRTSGLIKLTEKQNA